MDLGLLVFHRLAEIGDDLTATDLEIASIEATVNVPAERTVELSTVEH